MASELGVLRRCRCCDRWLSIDGFIRLGKVCEECIGGAASGRIARNRAIVLTAHGRATLREIHDQERQDAVA